MRHITFVQVDDAGSSSEGSGHCAAKSVHRRAGFELAFDVEFDSGAWGTGILIGLNRFRQVASGQTSTRVEGNPGTRYAHDASSGDQERLNSRQLVAPYSAERVEIDTYRALYLAHC